ncbi:Crp/Fnr family transcriptional regulator [Leptolyngbya sp. DQ-M1]|uniref:Crp/Fnr family transcriptional regulator n=1 Tax=Leptolyngbya sp. DQ-M1 TaxID=2933920 RepID=UPI0032991141
MPPDNQILATLSAEVFDRLAPHLQPVSLEQGKVIYRPGDSVSHLYFPIDSLFSVTITMKNGAVAEVGMAGSRDVVGIHACLGSREAAQTDVFVQVAGNAMKIEAQVMRQEFNRNDELRDVLLRYTQVFLAQVSQTAACNALHPLEQRLCRWLLEAQWQLNSSHLPLTQEFLSIMLGVRRPGVTQTAQSLQERRLIQYRRGNVHILNQTGLEASGCECFKTIKAQYQRLLAEQ